jgi:hypothetical protein
MVSAGLVEGAVLGAAQSVVLRREFLGFSRSSWIAATSVGAAAAWCLGMLPSTFYPAWTDWSPVLTVSLAVVLGLALLATIGFAQWLVLRHHLARSRTWVPANAVAWLLGLGVLMGIAMPLWSEGQSTVLVVAIGVLGGLAMAATVAVVTGVWLARLVRPRSGAAQVTRPVPLGVPEDDWTRLAQPTDRFRVFDPTQLEDLPDPVQRWMRHAITPGATPAVDGYVSGDVFGTGHSDSDPCPTAAGAARDQCEWSMALKGAAEKRGTSDVGAMLGARGCITRIQAPDTNTGICTPGIYLVTVTWQGMTMTAAPSATCAQDLYGDDKFRRAVSARVVVGLPSCS